MLTLEIHGDQGYLLAVALAMCAFGFMVCHFDNSPYKFVEVVAK